MTNTDRDTDIIAEIVAAYAARPDVGPDEIVELLSKLRQEVGGKPVEAAPAPAPAAQKPVPAMPIERAVTEDRIYCLCCGKGFKMLKRHLGSEHGLTEAAYRQMFDLPDDMPLVAPSYSRRKADYAKQAGFGKYDRAAQQAEAQRVPGENMA
ncbi:MucR family transcriptional regulator [Pseudoroseicyclus aestuarii]|uniref:MucR family transcriptional regulator n=1 Tax=Pseudoroseicyclus aestuarii TaxID=1795041 RepID=A0A318SS37_9RHOB|nr:MucR family transcriptional regulator [Pseudoroseicyclus aestuarii]PYE84362.1 MucR family transcriptional regulator [Pseudoroseicyclus aestuarii]